MPSPESDRLVARPPHHRHGDLRHGQLAGAVQSADPRGGRIRHDRLHLRRPADRRLPGRHADGHLLRLRHQPQPAAPTLSRGARPRRPRLDREGHVRLQRPLQPAALRQHLAAPGAAPASADLGARRRLGRDLALVRRDGLRLLLPVLLRLQGRPRHDGRFLGRNGSAGQGPQSLPGRLPAVHRRRRNPPAGLRSLQPRPPNISTAAACTSIRNGPRRPATPAKAASAPASKAR